MIWPDTCRLRIKKLTEFRSISAALRPYLRTVTRRYTTGSKPRCTFITPRGIRSVHGKPRHKIRAHVAATLQILENITTAVLTQKLPRVRTRRPRQPHSVNSTAFIVTPPRRIGPRHHRLTPRRKCMTSTQQMPTGITQVGRWRYGVPIFNARAPHQIVRQRTGHARRVSCSSTTTVIHP